MAEQAKPTLAEAREQGKLDAVTGGLARSSTNC